MRLSIKELQKYPCPNLIAEITESGYSICTVGEHMGLGRYLPEDSPKVWDRLTGKEEILASEAAGLMNLFGIDFDYLFSGELKVIGEEPYAYWRWFEHNKWKEQEIKKHKMRRKIESALDEKPYLLELVSKIVCMSEAEASAFMAVAMEGGAA